jgi:chorismate mutase/prephenate dehydratase
MLPEEEKLDEIRKRIDEIDAAIVDLLSKRMVYAKQIKDVKVRMNMPIKDRRREERVIENWCEHARRNKRGAAYDLSEEMMKKMAALIIEYTVNNELLANNSNMSVC